MNYIERYWRGRMKYQIENQILRISKMNEQLTGDYNTGSGNTGNGNATNYCSGFFCIEEPKVICFDIQTEFTRDEFIAAFFPEYHRLRMALRKKETIDFEKYKNLPGITPEKLRALHEKHLKGKCND